MRRPPIPDSSSNWSGSRIQPPPIDDERTILAPSLLDHPPVADLDRAICDLSGGRVVRDHDHAGALASRTSSAISSRDAVPRWPRRALRSARRRAAARAGGRAPRTAATRWRSPPDSSAGSAPARSRSPARGEQLVDAIRTALAAGTPRSASGSATDCANPHVGRQRELRALAEETRAGHGAGATRARGASRPMSRPSTRTTPADGGWSPAITRSRVLLPAPLGPSTHSSSPDCERRARYPGAPRRRPRRCDARRTRHAARRSPALSSHAQRRSPIRRGRAPRPRRRPRRRAQPTGTTVTSAGCGARDVVAARTRGDRQPRRAAAAIASPAPAPTAPATPAGFAARHAARADRSPAPPGRARRARSRPGPSSAASSPSTASAAARASRRAASQARSRAIGVGAQLRAGCRRGTTELSCTNGGRESAVRSAAGRAVAIHSSSGRPWPGSLRVERRRTASPGRRRRTAALRRGSVGNRRSSPTTRARTGSAVDGQREPAAGPAAAAVCGSASTGTGRASLGCWRAHDARLAGRFERAPPRWPQQLAGRAGAAAPTARQPPTATDSTARPARDQRAERTERQAIDCCAVVPAACSRAFWCPLVISSPVGSSSSSASSSHRPGGTRARSTGGRDPAVPSGSWVTAPAGRGGQRSARPSTAGAGPTPAPPATSAPRGSAGPGTRAARRAAAAAGRALDSGADPSLVRQP